MCRRATLWGMNWDMGYKRSGNMGNTFVFLSRSHYQAHIGVANAHQSAFLISFNRHIGSFKRLSHEAVASVE